MNLFSSKFAAVLSRMLEGEPNLENRIKKAKSRAKKIVEAQFEGEDDLYWWLVFQLSKYYKKPIYSKYFENRTLDELMFELSLIQEDNKPQEVKASEIIKENMDEALSMFEDFEDEINQSFSEEEMGFLNNQGRSFMQNGFDSIAEKD